MQNESDCRTGNYLLCDAEIYTCRSDLLESRKMLFVTSQNAERIVALPLSAKRRLKASTLVICFMINSSNVLYLLLVAIQTKSIL